ncbi:MAG: TldD/PmbA family protein, partial [Rhodococcus sp.]|nr:TldD/PmbA family protein [Rhodococcus sp. (in: high G+C Gram-positive bacteria)]
MHPRVRIVCARLPGYGVLVTDTQMVDADFLALPLRQLSDSALQAAQAAGAEHADLRVHRLCSTSIRLRDALVQSDSYTAEIGFAVRVLVDGTWGFASHVELTPERAAETAREAVTVARTLRALAREQVTLADEPVYRDASWVSEYAIDPFEVPGKDKIALLTDYSRRLLDADGVDHVSASCLLVKEQTYYADSAGSSITQQRVRVHPEFEAIAIDRDGGFDSMRTLAPPVGRGWEYLLGTDPDGGGGGWVGWDWDDELSQIPVHLAEKLRA